MANTALSACILAAWASAAASTRFACARVIAGPYPGAIAAGTGAAGAGGSASAAAPARAAIRISADFLSTVNLLVRSSMRHPEGDAVFQRLGIEIDAWGRSAGRPMGRSRRQPGMQLERADSGMLDHPRGIERIKALELARDQDVEKLPIDLRIELEVGARARAVDEHLSALAVHDLETLEPLRAGEPLTVSAGQLVAGHLCAAGSIDRVVAQRVVR